MNTKILNNEFKKSIRFLPANLAEVDVLISNNNKGTTFYFIKGEKILYKFTIEERD